MSLSQLSSNTLHYVFSTVSHAIAWKSPSAKVTGTVVFAAAQALAFYIFATVGDFSFPITMHYLSLRQRLSARQTRFISKLGSSTLGNVLAEPYEEILFNALIRMELAVDDRIRGHRDRPNNHLLYHHAVAICPCFRYPRLGIFSCYPLLFKGIKLIRNLGFELYDTYKRVIYNKEDFEVHWPGLCDVVTQDLGVIVGYSYDLTKELDRQYPGFPAILTPMTRYAGNRRLFLTRIG